MKTSISIDRSQVDVVLHRLEHPNFERVMYTGARILSDSVQMNFEEGGRMGSPGSIMGGSTRWAITNNPKPLVRQGMQGGLMGSMQPNWDRSSAWVSTNKPYAAAHNYGHTYGARNYGARSSLATKETLRPHSFGGYTLPARTFMVVQEEDIEAIKEVITKYLLGGVK